MGATSVTGVGQGSAEGSNKGPHNGREIYIPILSPHVVTAGSCTTSGGGTITVTFPTALTGDKSLYAVVASAATGTTSHSIAKTNDGSGNFASFTLTGAAATVHNYIVASTGTPFAK